MALEKIYTPIGWQNKPSTATPLGSHNLSKIDEALAEIDERVVELSENTEALDQRVEDAETDIAKNADDITRLDNRFTGFSTAMSQGMELLFDRVEEAEAKIEKNTEDIDALKIVPTASGSPVYIADASNMKIENIIFYGESNQMQTTGKNWFDITTLTPRSASQGGTVTFDKDVAYVSSANQAYAAIRTTINGFEIGKEYTIKFKISDYVGNQSGFTISLTTTSSVLFAANGYYGKTFTATSEELTFNVFSNWTAEFRTNTFTLSEMQLEEGAVASPYEPYSNRVASPSPDYPQPIESKTVNRVDVLGKNLLDCNGLSTGATNGITFTPVYENGLLKYINVNGTATANAYYTCKTTNIQGGSYVLTGFENPSSNYRSYLNSGGVEIVSDVRDNGNFSIASDSDIVFVIKVSSGITMNNVKCYPMVRLATITDATYEPYQSQTKSLASGTYRLDGIGDLKNYYDAKRGVYGEKVDRVTFDGSDDEAWSFGTTNNGRRMQINIPVKPVSNVNVKGNVLCNRYIVTTAGENYMEKQGIAVDTSSRLYVYDANFKSSLISDWKAYLQANPMTVVYEVAEPEEGNLISSVKDDFAEFLKLHTYKPNTVVINGADAEMDVSYVADCKLYVDGKIESLANSILSMVN